MSRVGLVIWETVGRSLTPGDIVELEAGVASGPDVRVRSVRTGHLSRVPSAHILSLTLATEPDDDLLGRVAESIRAVLRACKDAAEARELAETWVGETLDR